MTERRILVVDDTPDVLKYLADGLRKTYAVVACRSGEEAIEHVMAAPGTFEFAVIDQVLGQGIDGIGTCRHIADISRDVFILVFTNVPAVSWEELERHRAQAFAAGAHRYLERASMEDSLLQVHQFVDEMQQLATLRQRISEFYDERQHIPSLLTQLDLGVDIVDRSFKVWFMNDAMRRITGFAGPGLSRDRCSSWHGYQLCPCPGCLVAETLETGQARERLFLSPIRARGEGLCYQYIWCQPVVDDRGEIMRASDGKPLAVMETVQDLTDTERLRAMPLSERLAIIARALHERPRAGYRRIQPFERVAIYAIDPDNPSPGTLRLSALAGYSEALAVQRGAPFEARLVSNYDDLVKNMRETGWGYFSPDEHREDPISGERSPNCVFWPVLDGAGNLVAFVRASGPHCEAGDVTFVRPYAEEVGAAIAQCRSRGEQTMSLEAEQRLARIDNMLQTMASPEAALRFLLTEACEFTGSHLGHVRYRRGSDAVLARLSPHAFDGYERIAVARWPIEHRTSWSARTILSGVEQIRNNLPAIRPTLDEERQPLSEPAREVLRDARSFCFEPLLFDHRCIGAMGFHSKRTENYTGEKSAFLRQIARRAALALHDYLAKRTAEEQLESVQADAVQLLLHNISTPLGTLRNYVEVLRAASQSGPAGPTKLSSVAEAMERACSRIAKIREDFARLLHPHQPKPVPIDLHQLLRKSVADELAGRDDVAVAWDLDPRLVKVVTDDVAARSCVEVFVRNARDEFDRLGASHKHAIRVVLREADADEAGRATTSGNCLAVEVQDNGVGVPDDKRQLLFDIIHSSKSGGLGIGLVYGRRMARAAGGDVYLKDEAGPGAAFVALLPYQSPQRGENHADPHR